MSKKIKKLLEAIKGLSNILKCMSDIYEDIYEQEKFLDAIADFDENVIKKLEKELDEP